MPIRLVSSGAGSVILSPQSTASDVTLTVPAVTANVFTTAGGTITGTSTFSGQATFSNDVSFTSNNVSISGQTISPSYGMKNRLINGMFEIWQRGTTVAYLGDATPYRADRWGCIYYQNARHQRVAVSSAPTGLYARYACRASSSTTAEAAGGTRMACDQIIENINCFDLVGQTITLSFWVKFSAATISSSTATAYGDFAGGFSVSSSTADAYGRNTPYGGGSYTTITNGSLPTTWTKYTVTGTVAAGTTNIAARFGFNNVGSTAVADSAYYDITQVQLEQGPVATPYEFRQYGTELALCQRYYYRLSPTNNNSLFALGQVTSSTVVAIIVPFPVTMRTVPSAIEQTGTASNYKLWQTSTVTVACTSVPTHNIATTYNAVVNMTASTLSGTAGQASGALSDGTGYLGWTAEI